MKKKIVITGIGVTSASGLTVNEYWENLLAGKSSIKQIEKFDVTPFPTKIAGEITNFDPADYMERKTAKRTDRFTQFAIASSSQAIKDAELEKADIDKDRVGVLIGTGIGGISEFTKSVLDYDRGGWRKVSPFFIPTIITNIASGHIAIINGFRGPNFAISTACATSNHSLTEAYHIILRDEADIMVCGGSESAITEAGLSGFCTAKALSSRNEEPEKASRPFDVSRDGFVMGEGAGVLVLESEESALKRGAKIYAEFLGGGMSCDAYHLTAPCPDGAGATLSMNNALKNSGVEKEEINYINTHGTSTPLGDKAEIMATKNVFGDHIKNIKVNSTKSMIGHCLGAAGSLEAIAIIKSIETRKLHPSINIENQDPACDVDIVKETIDFDVNVAISNSFGFGGHNSTIVIKKYQQ